MDTYSQTWPAGPRAPPCIADARHVTHKRQHTPGGRRRCVSEPHPTCGQKEVAMTTLTLGAALSKSSIPLIDHVAAAATGTPRGASTALIILAVVVMIIVLRLSGSVLTPFKEIVKASLAALGAVLLTGVVIIALIVALVLSA